MSIIETAKKEIEEDRFRKLVEIEKKKILQKQNRSIWERIFPFEIKRRQYD